MLAARRYHHLGRTRINSEANCSSLGACLVCKWRRVAYTLRSRKRKSNTYLEEAYRPTGLTCTPRYGGGTESNPFTLEWPQICPTADTALAQKPNRRPAGAPRRMKHVLIYLLENFQAFLGTTSAPNQRTYPGILCKKRRKRFDRTHEGDTEAKINHGGGPRPAKTPLRPRLPPWFLIGAVCPQCSAPCAFIFVHKPASAVSVVNRKCPRSLKSTTMSRVSPADEIGIKRARDKV
ncbi:hypothetical protein PLICRDRAFT_43534 [Plicaturopsis crispa FD-325 SS-3]|nr:hypothetical protein PLICRDRAFT_43534 [Plicaturopsis crispa FD-325 SS-3]